MGSTSTRRLICLSSGGLDTPPDIPFAQRMVTKLVIQRMYRHGYDDMRRMETLIRAQNVRWTIIRPPMLTDGAPTGGYRTSNNTHLADATSINRSDLAKYMLDAITDQATWRSVVEISR
jgi:putative NADH-flavin reductase